MVAMPPIPNAHPAPEPWKCAEEAQPGIPLCGVQPQIGRSELGKQQRGLPRNQTPHKLRPPAFTACTCTATSRNRSLRDQPKAIADARGHLGIGLPPHIPSQLYQVPRLRRLDARHANQRLSQ